MTNFIHQKLSLEQDGLLVLKFYDFTLEHPAGRENINADCLSRSTHLPSASQTYHAIPVSKRTQPLLTPEGRQVEIEEEEEVDGAACQLETLAARCNLCHTDGNESFYTSDGPREARRPIYPNPENEMVDITNIGSSAQRLPVTPKKKGRGKKTPQMADLVF